MIASISNRELFVPEGDKVRKKSTRIANALAIELLHYGLKLDKKIIARISSHKRPEAQRLSNRILKMYTIGEVNPPLFPGWEDRTEFTFEEFVIQIFGYVFQVSGNDLEDPDYMSSLKEHVDYGKTKRLKLADDKNSRKKFDQLVNSRVALEKESQRDLVALAEIYHTTAPSRIFSHEARAAVTLGMVQSGMTVAAALQAVSAQPADALRYAAAERDFGGVKLPSDVLYAPVAWKTRVQLLSFLDAQPFDELCEAMGNNRSAWVRFINHYHVLRQREFRNRFTSVVAASLISIGSRFEKLPEGSVREFVESQREFFDVTPTGNMAYRTFASRIQSAVDQQDFEKFKVEIEKRPGYLLRNIGSLNNVCTRETEGAFVELVRQQVDQASPGVLFSIAQIDVDADFRIIDSKGNTTVTEASYSPVIGEVQGVIEREIWRRFGFPGQVVVDEKVKNKVVPFLATNAELDRGTRIRIEDQKYLYFLMHWVQKANQRTDLDHSYVCFDSNWNSETIYFGNQANSFIKQSGDITNAPAPHGGTEYGRIDLKKIPTNVQYLSLIHI